MEYTIKMENGVITTTWNGGRMLTVPSVLDSHPERQQPNPLSETHLSMAEFIDGTTARGMECHYHRKIPIQLHLPRGARPNAHYNHLRSLIHETFLQTPQEGSSDPHKGQIFNPYTGRWSWI